MSAEQGREYETLQEAIDSMPKVINEPCTRRVRVRDGEVFSAEALDWRKVVEK